ncbi:hypothetical protein AB0L57_22660 [Nocardia sp. NPDC052254]|uniref:hypothetical protein n=1 Tax=Nocardia sp. NPDC052254 TaxID=3155681 RepID=UPI0034364E1B
MAVPDIDCRQRAVAHAKSFLLSRADGRGVPRAQVSLSPTMDTACDAGDGRGVLLREFGRDIGFDLGDERFSASLALAHVPYASDEQDLQLAERLAEVVRSGRSARNRFGFFFDHNGFPPDSDCTAMAVGALHDRGLISDLELVGYGRELLAAGVAPETEADAAIRPGVVMVYWQDAADPGTLARGPRYDAVACGNTLYILRHAQARGLADPAGIITATTDYVVDHLLSGRFREGTRYYPRPEPFLHAISRLCAAFPDIDAVCGAALADGLADADEGEKLSSLDLALTVIAADNLGGDREQHGRRAELLARQDDSGGWPAGAYYRMGRLPLYWGSAALTSIFAAGALACDR